MQAKLINSIGKIAILGSMLFSASLSAKPIEAVIEAQCLREVNDSRVWRNALAMKAQQEQSATKRAACQCVYKEAMQDSSIKALPSDVNEDTHRDLVSKVVLKSLRTCTQQILN